MPTPLYNVFINPINKPPIYPQVNLNNIVSLLANRLIRNNQPMNYNPVKSILLEMMKIPVAHAGGFPLIENKGGSYGTPIKRYKGGDFGTPINQNFGGDYGEPLPEPYRAFL